METKTYKTEFPNFVLDVKIPEGFEEDCLVFKYAEFAINKMLSEVGESL